MTRSLVATWTSLAERISIAGECIVRRGGPTTSLGLADERVLGVALLARSLSNLRGALLLLREGQILESRTIVRCCYENLYWTLALVGEKKQFAAKMIFDYLSHKKAEGEFYFKFEEEFNQKSMAKLRKSLRLISQFSFPRMNPKEVALLGDAAKTYYKYAQLSSDAAHPTMASLKRHVETDQADNSQGLSVELRIEEREIVETLDYLCRAVMGTCIHVHQLLGHKPDAEFIELLKDFADHANKNVA